MEILQKIKPLNLKDFLGNRVVVNNILKLLQEPLHDKKIILITSSDGGGKTLLIDLLFKEVDYNILLIKKECLKLLEVILTFINNKNILSYLNNKPKCVIIENIDILIESDKNIIKLLEDLYPHLEKKNILLIITCRLNEDRKVLDMKNKIEPFKLSYPPIKDVFSYLMKFELIDDDKLLHLVTKYKGSIRDIIMNLHTNDLEVEENNRFKDLNSFEIISKIYKNNHSINELLNIKDDISIISYLLYENIPDELNNNFNMKNNIVQNYQKINSLYNTACYIEKYMYSHMDWFLFDFINIIKLYGVTLILKELSLKKTIKNEPYRFSQIISKISHKNIMNMKMKKSEKNNNIDSMEIFLLVDKIPTELKIKKKFKEEINIINTYQKYFSQ